MNTKNLNLTTYQLGDVTDWITGFSRNMDLIDNYAGETNLKIKNVESSSENLNQQVTNISHELTTFGEEMDTMNNNVSSISSRVQQNTSLINAIPKCKKYSNTVNNNNMSLIWYQITYNDLYSIWACVTFKETYTFRAGVTNLEITFTSTDRPFFQSTVNNCTNTCKWTSPKSLLNYFYIFAQVKSNNKIKLTLDASKSFDISDPIAFNFCLKL